MARVLVNPRDGVKKGAKDEASRATKMKDILGAYDQLVYDTAQKKYLPATKSDL